MGEQAQGLKSRQIVFVAVRLLGVYFLVQASFSLPQVAQIVFFEGEMDSASWAFAAGVLFLIVMGVVLWTKADGFARKLVRSEEDPSMNLPVTAGQLEMIALSLLGIFILVGAIPSLIAGIAELIAPRTFDPFAGGFGPTGYRGSKVIEVVGAAFRVVVGTWLVFGSRDFAAFLNRLRSRD